MSIWTKILAVQMAVKAVKKNGKNTFHKYDYATEQDVLAVKELMNQNGLVAFPTMLGYEIHQYGDKVQILQQIKYTVVDTETGETAESIVLGAGEDKGDKGAYKAATGANKYFYLKFFGVPTGDDPERDEDAPKGRPAPQRAAAPVSKPAPTQMKAAPPQIRSILQLMTDHKLTNEQVLQIGGIETLKGIDEAQAQEALNRLDYHVKEVMKG